MLQDVQERLVYRTYIYIRTDILQYAAAPGDLAYPEKLEMMEVWGGKKNRNKLEKKKKKQKSKNAVKN